MLSRFHLISEHHGQTEGQTDRRTELLYKYPASLCWRAIKINHFYRHPLPMPTMFGQRSLPRSW